MTLPTSDIISHFEVGVEKSLPILSQRSQELDKGNREKLDI